MTGGHRWLARGDKAARAFYLHLRGIGCELSATHEPDEPMGYRLVCRYPPALGGPRRRQLGGVIRAHKLGLLRVLTSRRNPDLLAVRSEGRR